MKGKDIFFGQHDGGAEVGPNVVVLDPAVAGSGLPLRLGPRPGPVQAAPPGQGRGHFTPRPDWHRRSFRGAGVELQDIDRGPWAGLLVDKAGGDRLAKEGRRDSRHPSSAHTRVHARSLVHTRPRPPPVCVEPCPQARTETRAGALRPEGISWSTGTRRGPHEAPMVGPGERGAPAVVRHAP